MLEREIIERIREIEAEEARRRAGDFLSKYNAGRKKHKKQMAFHKCRKRNRWVFGGNRSGKTECGAVECVYMARGVHPYRKNKKDTFGWVVSLSQQVQRDVAQKKVLHYLRPDWIESVTMLSGRKDSAESGVIDQIRVKNVFGGISVIGFKSCDQGREKFQGSSLDYVWFDEEPPKDIYDECRMRVLDKCGDIFGTMTPLKGITFLYDEIYLNRYENPEIWYEFMEWGDNPFLKKSEIALLTEAMGENELLSRRYGKFAMNEGLVYPEFDENIHVIEPMAGRGRRQSAQTDRGQTALYGDFGQVRRPRLRAPLRTGDAHGHHGGVIFTGAGRNDMKVREILCAAAGMLGRADAAAFLTDGVGADVRALEGEVSALLRAYNLTESETALVYRPLRLSEKVSSADGTIAYSAFSERPVNVEKVRKGGEEVDFTLLTDALKTAAGEVEVLYRYAPAAKTAEDDSEYGQGEARALALGTCCEYALSSGLYDEAVLWDKRYKDALAALCRACGGTLKARRWV